ncbi:MAG: type II secretion system protein [Eubacteriales bacterium]|nr:type II secretion system protein [Eubacteriales bacterium]
MKMLKKIKNQRGFTLTEMLATLIILGLVTLCAASGIATAVRCYQDLMFESESRLLISSLDESIKDILRYAPKVEVVKEEGTPKEDKYKKVKNFSFYKEKYSQNDNNRLSKYQLTEGEFSSVNGKLKLNNSVVGGTGIYSQSLRIEDFQIWFNEIRGTFQFSYQVSDDKNHRTKTHQVYVNSWMYNQ